MRTFCLSIIAIMAISAIHATEHNAAYWTSGQWEKDTHTNNSSTTETLLHLNFPKGDFNNIQDIVDLLGQHFRIQNNFFVFSPNAKGRNKWLQLSKQPNGSWRASYHASPTGGIVLTNITMTASGTYDGSAIFWPSRTGLSETTNSPSVSAPFIFNKYN